MLTFNEYMTLVEQAPIMIWRAGLDKLCDYFNKRWLDFTGRTMEQERATEKVEAERLLQESKENEIKRLRHLLPVCAWCKKIRSNDGYWQEVEQYFSAQNLGRITHGICSECAAKTAADGSATG